MSSAGFPYTTAQRKWWFATHPNAAAAVKHVQAQIDGGDRSDSTLGRLYSALKDQREEEARPVDGSRRDELIQRYKDGNPFAVKAATARMEYERLTGAATAGDSMASSFPLGGGFQRSTSAYAENIDRTVKNGVALGKAKSEMDSLEHRAAAFDAGLITKQGLPVTRLEVEAGTSKTGQSGFFVKGAWNGKALNMFTEHEAVARRVRMKLMRGDALTPEDIKP